MAQNRPGLSYVVTRGSHVVVVVLLHLWVKWQVGPQAATGGVEGPACAVLTSSYFQSS